MSETSSALRAAVHRRAMESERAEKAEARVRELEVQDVDLRRAATAAWHLCQSLLACPGATPELIQEVLDALEKALGGRP